MRTGFAIDDRDKTAFRTGNERRADHLYSTQRRLAYLQIGALIRVAGAKVRSE